MKPDRNFLSLLAFGIGIGALVAALLRYLFVPLFDLWVQALLGLCVIGLAAGVMLNPERVRVALRGRQARYGSNALVLSLAVTGIVVLVNILAYGNSTRIDLTEDRSFSLAEETLLLLSELDRDVQIIGFYTPDNVNQRDNMRPILDEYVAQSGGLVRYELIDPLSDPVAADHYGITRDGSMVVIMGEATHVIDFPNEREISSAIVRLSNPEQRTVYFLIGHGERDIEESGDDGLSRLKDALEGKNYVVETTNLLVDAQVPEDASVLVVAGPSAPISSDEVAVIQEYLERGGALVFLQEPTVVSGVSVEDDLLAQSLEAQWGLRARDDLVIDLNSLRRFDGIAFQYAEHVITSRMQNLASYYPSARSMQNLGGQEAGVTVTPFVFTGDNSWGESDTAAVVEEGLFEFNQEQDTAGPLTLAMAVDDFSINARAVWVGDSDFASNREFFNLGNGDLVINSVDWAARQESLVNITPRSVTQRRVVPASRQTAVIISLTTLVLMPGSVAGLGAWVWWDRRKRA